MADNLKDPDKVLLQFKYFHIISILFVVSFVTSKAIASKFSSMGIFTFNVGTLVFPLSYIFSAIATEVYGYERARQLIWFALFCNLLFILFTELAILLPSPSFWQQQKQYEIILGSQPRLAFASLASYLIGDFINCYLISKTKILYEGKWTSIRFILSSAVGLAIDNTAFLIFAFLASYH